ncbi:YfiT family bacillithiol transferase [Aquiflexum gelatinilyticum]|uniref:Metal-dependent hydrolase n=1 Tax=Aquiflexum gelatinilyticum TaxID=2961943 RepID=A0A9X2SZR9_9BACT|nr:putative metal-dependent hydrolase [Aquiflexum gelatinilyticum]MCR9017072.1 putative metal-dependent hydrolase [Aquiflexum gelatinilyticum]MCS4435156.1 putative metal-dependent hydrolase [Aquiflexum gelatinilyticum]
MEIESLKFPVGRFSAPKEITAQQLEEWVGIIEEFPALLKTETYKLSEEQLDTPYRPEGWTVRQVVHHCADSHMNSFIRFKLALTEDNPTIKPYHEDLWAELADAKDMPIGPSLKILEGLHYRWVVLIKSLSADDLQKTFFHPANQKTMSLATTIALYAWHSRHHLGHVKLVSGGK